MIDGKTIAKSHSLPEDFLRGCGLSDWEILATMLYDPMLTEERTTDVLYEIDRLRVGNPIRFYSCFIAYSHEDKDFARRIYADLQAQGVRCWLDDKQMLPGDDIYQAVDRGIRLWDKVLLCCSEASLASWWVDSEIDTAFERERKLMKDRGEKILSLIPLNLDGYLFSGRWKSGKARQVKSRLAPDFTEWESNDAKYQDQLKQVVRALRAEEITPRHPGLRDPAGDLEGRDDGGGFGFADPVPLQVDRVDVAETNEAVVLCHQLSGDLLGTRARTTVA